MRGRSIHTTDGQEDRQLYSLDNEVSSGDLALKRVTDHSVQCINSVDRSLLNLSLLNEIESLPDVSVEFDAKLSRIDFDKSELYFVGGSGQPSRFDLVVGCDGAYSKVREQMMRSSRYESDRETTSNTKPHTGWTLSNSTYRMATSSSLLGQVPLQRFK